MVVSIEEKGQTRCSIPGFDGAFLSHESNDALWTSSARLRHNDRDHPSSDTT